MLRNQRLLGGGEREVRDGMRYAAALLLRSAIVRGTGKGSRRAERLVALPATSGVTVPRPPTI